MDNAAFPCSGCGSCCKRINRVVELLSLGLPDPNNELSFPYSWDETGRCEKLGEDNKCMVYENRPAVCNMSKMQKFFGYSDKDWLEMNVKTCNKIMDEDSVAPEFRLSIPKE